jgi:hypothetical protein
MVLTDQECMAAAVCIVIILGAIRRRRNNRRPVRRSCWVRPWIRRHLLSFARQHLFFFLFLWQFSVEIFHICNGTRFVDPPLFFKFFNSSLLWDVFIINKQCWTTTQYEIDISPFLKTQKPSSTLFLFSL